MKYPAILPLALLAACMSATPAWADRIFRCGNEYTNNVKEAEMRGCRPVEGGNVTIVQGTRVNRPASGSTAAAPQPAVKVANNDTGARGPEADAQRARDNDARAILTAELKKTEARLADLQREYNNGEPERRGDERNYQRYQDRVADLKANIARAESDLQGLRRELSRLTGAGPTAQ